MSRYKPYPAYKDSGVEWIGKVPEGWRIVPLKALAQIVNGATPESGNPKYWDGDIAWFTPADLDNENVSELIEPRRRITAEGLASCVARLTPAGSVILSTRAPVGSVGVTLIPSATNQGCRTLVTNPRILPKLLAEMLVAARSELSLRSNGTTFQELSTDSLASLRIPLAPLEEQTAIVSFLDHETVRIDALIAKKIEFIELLAKKRQALITHAVTKGLDPNVKMKDSGVEWIGEVPVHWTVKRLKHLIEEPLQYGANESGDSSIEEGPRYIRITDLDDAGELRNNSVKRLPPDVAQPYMLNDGDILFARSGATVGKTYRYKSEHGSACFAGYLIRARLDRKIVDPDFVILAVRSHYYWAYIQRTAIQATIENVGAEHYGDFPVAVPDCDEQKHIVAAVSSRLARIDLLAQKTQLSIDLLKKRRSALITAAVTGQIDLREST